MLRSYEVNEQVLAVSEEVGKASAQTWLETRNLERVV